MIVVINQLWYGDESSSELSPDGFNVSRAAWGDYWPSSHSIDSTGDTVNCRDDENQSIIHPSGHKGAIIIIRVEEIVKFGVFFIDILQFVWWPILLEASGANNTNSSIS